MFFYRKIFKKTFKNVYHNYVVDCSRLQRQDALYLHLPHHFLPHLLLRLVMETRMKLFTKSLTGYVK